MASKCIDLVGRATPVVFVTAYDEFAVRAFDVHAVDYLLKPVSAARVSEAIARVRQRLGRPPEALPAELRAGERKGPLERVLVRDGTKVHVIDVDDLEFVQAQDDYVAFHAGGTRVPEGAAAQRGRGASSMQARFVRVHRSFVVNIERIARVEPLTRDSRVVILKDGRRLPVSRAGFQRLTTLLEG